LAMIGMQAAAMSAATDARNRAEAAAFANDIIGRIWISVDRSSTANLTTSLNSFRFNTGGSDCSYSGGATDATNTELASWVSAVTSTSTGLIGATTSMQQVAVNTGSMNQVTVTLCWKTASDVRSRKHQVMTYVY
jgi:hypothetical protein